MKLRSTILVLSAFVCMSIYAQKDKGYNVISIETGLGFVVPISPIQDINVGNYISPRHFDLGARYMFNEYLGVKGYFSFDRFQDKTNKETGNSYNRFGASVVYNIVNKLSKENSLTFNGLLHAGVGVTQAYPGAIKRFKETGEFTFGITPQGTKDYERIGNIIIGFTPQYRISNQIALRGDVSYVFSIAQQYSYNGELLFPDFKKVNGGFVNFSVGVQFYLGKNRRHADWYNSHKFHRRF